MSDLLTSGCAFPVSHDESITDVLDLHFIHIHFITITQPLLQLDIQAVKSCSLQQLQEALLCCEHAAVS